MISDELLLAALVIGLGGTALVGFYSSLSLLGVTVFMALALSLAVLLALVFWQFFSKSARERLKKLETFKELPDILWKQTKEGVTLGRDCDLHLPIFLPDNVRSRHVHILGATGSGKTESVILNFLKQDVGRGIGSIILDAKGDHLFLRELESWVPPERLKVFDLGSHKSLSYDPLASGNPMESAQRLFSSLTWSEEYYKSKALSALQRIFQGHSRLNKGNPQIADVSNYLETPKSYSTITTSENYDEKAAEKEFMELSGLRDQVRSLTSGHLSLTLSPEKPGIDFDSIKEGAVIYFRLQSLLSPQLVAITGRLIINHLNYLAGSIHRGDEKSETQFIPVYLDEFASFACAEFADLISKARSAGFALHFSHQSVGDLVEVSKGFLNRITDNSATKIVMRINDPDSADYFARSFGTRIQQKVTHKITNAEDIDLVETSGEGSLREVHQFRASPDLLKTLPTGVGAVLIAHGIETPHGASSVFKIRFPRLIPVTGDKSLTKTGA